MERPTSACPPLAAMALTSSRQRSAPIAHDRPIAYAVGLEPLIARALYADLRADLPSVVIRRRQSLQCDPAQRPHTPAPDLVLLDLNLPDLSAEVQAVRTAWGDQVVIVGIGRTQPFTLV